MKQIISILLLSLIFSFNSYSQNSFSTTNDEYNYMVNGYKTTIENSLDIKKGYSVTDMGTQNINGYKFNYIALLRSDSKDLCGVIVKCLSAWGNTYYIAIPIKNDILMNQYFDSLEKFDLPFMKAYNRSLSSVFSNIIYSFQKQNIK